MLQQTTKTIRTLNDALNNSIEFYSSAALAAKHHTNKDAFNHIALARTAILAYLQSDNPETQFKEYTFGSALQKVYPDMFHGLAEKTDPTLVKLVRKHETKLQLTLQDAIENIHSDKLIAVLLDVFPQLNGEHARYLLDDAS